MKAFLITMIAFQGLIAILALFILAVGTEKPWQQVCQVAISVSIVIWAALLL